MDELVKYLESPAKCPPPPIDNLLSAELDETVKNELQGIPKNKDHPVLQLTQSVNRACLILIHHRSQLIKYWFLSMGNDCTLQLSSEGI